MRQKIHAYSIVAALTALTFLAVGCTMASTQDISITATDTTFQTMQTAPAASPPNSLTESSPLLLTPISKEELYHKMRNSVDYFSQISGKIIDSKDDSFSSSTTMAAHFDGDEYTEAELEDIRAYAEFVKNRRNGNK